MAPTTHSDKVSIVIPAYNEESAIGIVIKGYKEELENSRIPYEIVVVDNNSQDRTRIIAEESGAKVILERNQGYGFACTRGLREASGNLIILTEGDDTFNPHDIWKLLVYLREDDVDMVLGTRTTLELVERDAKMTRLLHWGNIGLGKLIQIQFWGRCRLTDVGCTFRAVKRDALDRIVDDLREGGPCFSPVMIILALKRNLRLVEVPIRYRIRRGQSKITETNGKSLRLGLRMVRLILSQAFW